MHNEKATYRLLVVDDEDGIRAIIRKYAEYEGHTVTEAADGMEAVLKVKNGEFDLVIMDIMMPELDGFSACRQIRKTSDVPILMLSARGEEYDLLFYMVKNRNLALSREKLITEVWGYEFYGDDRTLDTHIKLLRRSLGEYSRFIVTVRSVGYRFEVETV